MANQRIYNLRIIAMNFVEKPLARNDRFLFQKFKVEIGNLIPISTKLLFKN
jgi:hypothetical protein